MIRVLHIVTIMNRGGLETFIMNVYRKIDRSKIQFDFLVHRDEEGAYDKEIFSLGGRIFHVRAFNPINLKYYIQLYHVLKTLRNEVSVIHSHLDTTSAMPLFLAKCAGYDRRVAHSHSSSVDRDWKYFIRLVLAYPIRFLATDRFSCGIDAGKFIFGRKSKFQVINNGIDVKEFAFNEDIRQAVRRELGITNQKVVIHVGRFYPVKNQEFIVKQLCENASYSEKVIFVLVGDGPDRKRIEKYCRERKLMEKVKFLGVRNDISRLLQGADVFVFPSLFEGLGIAVIEGQASGLPCLVSDTMPKECVVTDLVKVLPLLDTNAWINNIESTKNNNRYGYNKIIKKNGYDIKETTFFLQEFYLHK